MSNTHNYPDTISAIHKRVMSRVEFEKPTPAWKLIFGNYLINTLCIICLVLSAGLITWFINNLIQNRVLLRPSLIDISGIEWVWSPELLLLALGTYTVAVLLQKHISFSVFKYAGIGVLIGFGILTNTVFSAPTTQAFQSNIQPQYNSLGYPQFSRDYHVKVLLDNNKYYGLVINQNTETNTMEINHGGIIKSFKTPVDMPKLVGQPVEVKFQNSGVEYLILSYLILK
jgi:hypothetical protein